MELGQVFRAHVACDVLTLLPGLEFEVGINEFSPRILFYRGLNGDTNDQDYPYSTNDNTALPMLLTSRMRVLRLRWLLGIKMRL